MQVKLSVLFYAELLTSKFIKNLFFNLAQINYRGDKKC